MSKWGERLSKVCPTCGVSFEVRMNAKAQKQIYCSRVCAAGGIKPTSTCQHCGREYKPKHNGDNKKMYCSRECAFASKSARKIERQVFSLFNKLLTMKKCICCGKQLAVNIKGGYCSDECRREVARVKSRLRGESNHRPIAFKCKQCGVDVTTSYSRPRKAFCSDSCSNKHQRKKRPDQTTHRKRARYYGVEYQYVNKSRVFDRDSWTCQMCGVKTPRRLKGRYVDAAPELDHIIPLSKGGSHTYANVQCACRRCNGLKGNGKDTGQISLFG